MNLHFGLASVAILRESDNSLIGASRIPAEIKAAINTPLVLSNGGAAAYPQAARKARSEASMTITLNERPEWMNDLLTHGRYIPPLTASFLDVDNSTLPNDFGNYINADEPLGLSWWDTATLSVDRRNQSLVITLSSGGRQVTRGLIPGLLFTRSEASTYGIEMTQNWHFDINAPAVVFKTAVQTHQGKFVPQKARDVTFKVIAYTASGGSDDRPSAWEFPHVEISLPDRTATDNEPSNAVELQCLLNTARDSDTPIAIRRIL